ncbi:DUF2235 domain-containing protein [Marinobacter halodurans]|uniref:DUF2235 domain-containing protein n=2 Tax=Marinobacter halodurans TaxID=2528979 RepID=A0ABY1ZDE7_9GAMM|nr:DUF2235 domain-containing protein [Marinobacter halodurans]
MDMQIKRPRDLELRDLPRIESPTFAPSNLPLNTDLASPSLHAALKLADDFIGSPYRSDREQMNRLKGKLRDGTLVLVKGTTDTPPFSPLIAWEEDGVLPGRWKVVKDVHGLNLASWVARMNDWQITPAQVERLGPGSVGHLSANSFDSDLRERRAAERERAQQNSQKNLSLPVGAAAGVAPLVAEAGDTSDDERVQKELHIEVGIFLDGTLNDASNVKEFLSKLNKACSSTDTRDKLDPDRCRHHLALKMGASYSNARTNVSKLFDLYRTQREETTNHITHTLRVYKNGVGTTNGEDDSLWSSATGLGSSGILEQVKAAFKDTASAIARTASGKPLRQLTVDLFGFSRGSAAARHAASEIAKGEDGLFAKSLQQQGVVWPKGVSIRFAGLFDTVAGIVNILEGDFSAANNETDPVNVFLDPDSVASAAHITAADECRENFALNSLSNPDGTLPPNFREISLPGVHSDIGGGYHKVQDEHVLLARKRVIADSRTENPEQTMDWDNLDALLHDTQNGGWVGENSIQSPGEDLPSLEINKTFDSEPAPYGRVTLKLEMKRRLRGEYSGIPLRLMHALASEAGVMLDEIDDEDPAFSLPNELLAIHQSVSKQVAAGTSNPTLQTGDLSLLKQRYIHHSDNFNTVEFMLGGITTDLEVPWDMFLPFMPTSDRVRIVHPNKAEHS